MYKNFEMLHSKGFRRNFRHNLFLAVFFAFVAGIVNVFGLLELGTFTTNITGHVGEFALSLELLKWTAVYKITLWIAAFGFGSFTSSLIVNYFEEKKPKLSYSLPIIVEIIFLLWCFSINNQPEQKQTQTLILLFAMGIQNGIVSVVSGKVVRTTHLTGMVTDVGLGLGKLILKKGNLVFVKRSLILNISIITMFIAGGAISTYLTIRYHENVLLIPIILLVSILIYDLRTIETGLKKMKKIREKLHF